MRRSLLLLSLCFLPLFSPVWGQSSNEQGEVAVVASVNDDAGLTNAANALKKLQAKRIELLSVIRLEQERVLEGVEYRDEIQTLLAEIDVLLRESANLTLRNNDISFDKTSEELQLKLRDVQTQAITKMLMLAQKTEYPAYASSTTFPEGQRMFPLLRAHALDVLRRQEAWIIEAENQRSKFIEGKKSELAALDLEITRLEKIRSDLMYATFGQAGGYVLVFALLYLLRIFSRQLLVRFGRNFSKTHQEALHLWHRWLFYILFIGAFLVLFSSEFVSFLPFLAIFGTAVGFALKDVVFSIIGWFVIGTDSGYREADFIEFDTTVGRVFRISPLLTSIEEYGVQWFTGKIVSFPNKTIFEKNVKNWSRGSDFSLMSLDFLLTHDSDISRAKELLMEVVGSKELALYYSSRRELRLLKNTYGYTDEDLKPRIDVMTDSRGLTLRVRILIHVKDRLAEQSRITEEFATLVQQEEKVAMRQI